MKTWTITDPHGKTWTVRSAKRAYTHAIVRENKDNPGRYFVSWATSLEKAQAESRVLAWARSYNEIVEAQPA